MTIFNVIEHRLEDDTINTFPCTTAALAVRQLQRCANRYLTTDDEQSFYVQDGWKAFDPDRQVFYIFIETCELDTDFSQV